MNKWIAFVLLVSVSLASWAKTHVTEVRVWASPERVRVVFELSEAKDYKLFTLKNPDRVVIDLKDSAWRPDSNKFDLQDSGIKKIRKANKANGDLRVVLDLQYPLTPNSFILQPQGNYGHRLVVDLDKPKATSKNHAKTEVGRSPTSSTALPSITTRDFIIAIDAGHGGEDPGAIGRKFKTREKDIVLNVSKKLEKLVNNQPGMRAFLVRTGDYYIGLRKRMQIARQQGADLFISIHADSFKNTDAQGASVYILSSRGASSEAARWLAESENRADLIGGISLDDKGDVLASVLLDLSQTANLSMSEEVAENILNSLSKVVKLHQTKVQRAGFAVLKSPDVPSLLVELGFISNHQGEANLKDDRYQTKLAQALLAGIKQHFSGKSRPIVYENTKQAAPQTYVVKSGDTLSHIAARLKLSTESLIKMNGLKKDSIYVGQILILPNERHT